MVCNMLSKAALAEHVGMWLPADDPVHLPHLIGPMKHYLWILKTTHGGADMDTCLEMAKGALDGKAPQVHAFRV